MEQERSFETPDKRKNIIDKASLLGVEHEEVHALIVEWIERKESEADRIGTPRANIETNFEIAMLYNEIGLLDEAKESLNFVIYESEQNGFDDIYNKAFDLFEEINLEKDGK